MSKSTVGTGERVCMCIYTQTGMNVPEVPRGMSLSGFQANTVHAAHRKMGRNPSTNAVHCNRRQYQSLASDVHR